MDTFHTLSYGLTGDVAVRAYSSRPSCCGVIVERSPLFAQQRQQRQEFTVSNVLSIIQGSAVRVTSGTLFAATSAATLAQRVYNALNASQRVLVLCAPITDELAESLLSADGADNVRVIRDTSTYKRGADKGSPRIAAHVAGALDRVNANNPAKADKLGSAVYGDEYRDGDGSIVAFWMYATDADKAAHVAEVNGDDDGDNDNDGDKAAK